MAETDDRNPPPDEAAGADTDEPQPWGAGAAPPRARWRRWAIWAGAGVVAIVLAVAVGWPAVGPLLPDSVTGIFADRPTPPDPELATLGVRTGALESAVAGLDGRIASAAATAKAALPRSEAARLGNRIEALETRPAPLPPAPDGRIAPLAERVESLAARLETIERIAAASSGEGGAPAAPGIAALLAENARLAAALGRMTERVARLEEAADPELARKVASAGAKVDRIEADLKRLTEDERTRTGDALLLAVGQLRAKAAGSGPFDAELSLVLKAAGGDSGIEEAAEPLAAIAPGGVPTRAELTARFPRLAAKAAQAALVPEDGDWLNRTAARLSRVVTVRRVGEGAEKGEGALAAIARAENRLASGDLVAAAAVLEALDGAPGEVFDEWRAAARARAAAEAAIARLSRRAVERFAAAGQAG